MGVAYKKDIDDVRESPALDVMLLLQQRGAVLTYSDPHAPEITLDGATLQSDDSALTAADCVVIITNHSAFDYQDIVAKSRLVVDTRNACKSIRSPKVVRL
jgi:UDP-N-acetyl-D-glucosamine dehydrogenase